MRFDKLLRYLPSRLVLSVLEKIRVFFQPWLDARLESMDTHARPVGKDFIADVDYWLIEQEPLRARLLIKMLFWIVVLFLILAAVIQIDEVTRGEGKVIPSLQLQVLQSLDGGIVSQIAVKEGSVVLPGQLLVQIDSTRFESSAREGQAQYWALRAREARLRALANGTPFAPPIDALGDRPEILEEERHLYETKASELEAQLSISRQQLSQRNQELSEARAKREQASQAYELSLRELNVTKPLLASGAVSEVDLLRLERDVSRFRGDREMASAQISRLQAAVGEAQRKIQEVELNFRNEARKEMAEVIGKIDVLSEGKAGLEDKVKHSAIRAPVKGTVKRLFVNTIGGVVQPGRDIVEVVPFEDTLLLEAKVSPRDIAFLHPGLRAIVKFTAYDFSIYGGLEGKLEHISADSVTDEKGFTYYFVRVRTEKSRLGENLPIIPGMVAEVNIVTGQKSLLTFLLKPVIRAKQMAFTER